MTRLEAFAEELAKHGDIYRAARDSGHAERQALSLLRRLRDDLGPQAR